MAADLKLVWLASFPKSGSTWLRAFLTALSQGIELDLNDLEDRHFGFRSMFESLSGLPSAFLTADQVARIHPLLQDTINAAVSAPFTMKIHDSFGSVAEALSPRATKSALYLVRDPRDVAISYAHHRNTTIDFVIDIMASGEHAFCAEPNTHHPQFLQHIGTWSDHVRSWLDQTRFPVHVMRYEDTLADPAVGFRRALDFAGIKVQEQQFRDALAATQFGLLQKKEQSTGFREKSKQASHFFRKGQAGDWKSALSAAQVRRIEAEHGSVMHRLGYL